VSGAMQAIASQALLMLAPNIETDQTIPPRFAFTSTDSGLATSLFAFRQVDDSSAPLHAPKKRPHHRLRMFLEQPISGSRTAPGSPLWGPLDAGFLRTESPPFVDMMLSKFDHRHSLLFQLKALAHSSPHGIVKQCFDILDSTSIPSRLLVPRFASAHYRSRQTDGNIITKKLKRTDLLPGDAPETRDNSRIPIPGPSLQIADNSLSFSSLANNRSMIDLSSNSFQATSRLNSRVLFTYSGVQTTATRNAPATSRFLTSSSLSGLVVHQNRSIL
jgi:hypothetical protein